MNPGNLDLDRVRAHWAAGLGVEWEWHRNLGCLEADWEVSGGLKGIWDEAVSLGEGHRDSQLPAGPSSPFLLSLGSPAMWVLLIPSARAGLWEVPAQCPE